MVTTGEPGEYEPTIKATFVKYDDHADECTLHPADPPEHKRMTEWITAKQGAYVSLGAWR